jgi:hypothetical protein
MELDCAQQEILQAAKYMISGCEVVYVNTAIYFPSSYFFLVEHSSDTCLLSIGCFYLFRLINHETGIKASMCVHHTFLHGCGSEQLQVVVMIRF